VIASIAASGTLDGLFDFIFYRFLGPWHCRRMSIALPLDHTCLRNRQKRRVRQHFLRRLLMFPEIAP